MPSHTPVDDYENECRQYLLDFMGTSPAKQQAGYHGLYSVLHRYIRWNYRDHNDSFIEEVVQNALLAVYKHCHKYGVDAIDKSYGWLHTVASNEVKALYKREAKGKGIMVDGEHISREDNADDVSIVDMADDLAAQACLQAIINALKKEVKGPDDMVILEGLALGKKRKEIAADLNFARTEKALTQRIYALRKTLIKLRAELC